MPDFSRFPVPTITSTRFSLVLVIGDIAVDMGGWKYLIRFGTFGGGGLVGGDVLYLYIFQ